MTNPARTRVSILEESAFGVVPAPPRNFYTVAYSRQNIAEEQGNATSQNITGLRRVFDVARLARQIGGGIQMDFSADDPATGAGGGLFQLIKAQLGQDDSFSAQSTTAATLTSGAKTITTGSIWAGVENGDIVKIGGSPTASENKPVRITSGAGTTTLTTDHPNNFAAASAVTLYRGLRMKDGTTKRSFLVEVARLDDLLFALWTGMRVNTWDLTVSDQAIATSRFGMLGKVSQANESTSYATTSTNLTQGYPVFDSLSVPVSSIGGVRFPFKTLTMSATNNCQVLTQVSGSDAGPFDIAYGNWEARGSIASYLDDFSHLVEFQNNTETSLWICMMDFANRGWSISFPRIKWLAQSAPTDGPNTFEQQSLEFGALASVSEDCTVRVQLFS